MKAQAKKVVLKKYFDSIAQRSLGKLDGNVAHNLGFNHLVDRYRQFISKRKMSVVLELVDTHPDLHICDFGCGAGEYMLKFLQKGATVTGIDLSVKMAKLAKKKLVKSNVWTKGDVLVADAEKIVLKRCSIIIAIGVMDYYSDCRRLLGNIRKTLIPNGKLIIDFPNLRHLSFPLLKTYYLLKKIPVKFYTERSVREILMNQGFRVIKTKCTCGSIFAIAVANKKSVQRGDLQSRT